MNQQALKMNKGPEQDERRTKRRLAVDMDRDMEEEKDTNKSLSCCRRKQNVKRVSRRRASRGKGRSRRSRSRKSRSRSRTRHSRSRKGRSRRPRRSRRRSRRSRKSGKRGRSRKSRRRSRKSRRRRGRSRKSRSRRLRRRKSRRSRRSKSRKSRRRRRRRRSKAEIIADNREQLTKSQSLTTPSAKTLPDKDAAIANLEAPVTPYSPMRKDKRTRPSQDGAILKAAQPVIERDVRFEPMRSPDERPKKEDDAPSTAIDIDSSIKRRRPKPPAYQAATEAAVRREQVMRQREEERFMRPPTEEPAVEQPAFQRVPDMVPIEEGIDPDYPAQRIVISNFVRNGCHIKRWLYEDSYPLDAPRPSIYGLTGKGRQYPNCCCGRRGLCYGCCGRGSTSKQRGYIQDNYENDRIRGELQRLDVILKNLED
ncbi:unnamed protein product [Cylicocyclus nassatus]|uniref:Uncharacterized protein n=1 Tax=Cylicocyclus nassatus TaxID=53992 RepID=A0AA36H4W5_CYLNA|nr:unnamed protein product [Cylicocyclus nassatus]